ncbi:GntR family transcriptional regulator [Paenibacillus xerothermodurans]|uniref:GntR family transcriptional regulator n=1 Tax=Paenibacillus xerothermodurans TaxID=1977292 RepID=A0A2W1NTL0_PAEXE|nr:GntR family transcriptional regulator [Paenibacillus xerothermodurans]PZE21086.1 GntR family transcriptional regulator [Paenibacillus xerothermodurans]
MKKVVYKSLAEQVYEAVKEAIIKAELKSGDRIIELELAKTYGVSQSTVREALSMLRRDELVITHANKGTYVSNFSKKDVEEMYSFREVVELFAIKRAIEKVQAEDVAALAQIYQEMIEAGKTDDIEKMRMNDVAFHSVIYKIADHSFAYQVWQDITNRMNRIWYCTGQYYFSNLLELAEMHKPIVDAFKNRDKEAACDSFISHLNYVRHQLLGTPDK